MSNDRAESSGASASAPAKPAAPPKPSVQESANRLNLDYRNPPPRRLPDLKRIDAHTHVYDNAALPLFIEAADLYGIGRIFSMTPLDQVDGLKKRLGDRIEFIAIPDWKKMAEFGPDFVSQWVADLGEFWRRGARICKLWMAPRIREKHRLSADDPRLRPVVEAALDLGYHFMIHAGDPSAWWSPGKPYADTSIYRTKPEQYEQVEWLAEKIAPRVLIGAHMGGTIEDPQFLQGLLDRHANYIVDTSACKWIVREVARRPEEVRAFMLRNAGRVLFGSDLVVGEKLDHFDHYASRYWCQQMMWESAYRGESPIDDPDGDNPPRLAGVNLPEEVLRGVYGGNCERWLGVPG